MPSVRSVDVSDVPEMQGVGERVRKIGNEFYPKIIDILGGDPSRFPRQFDIVFKKDIAPRKGFLRLLRNPSLTGSPFGKTKGKTIFLSAATFRESTNDLAGRLIHEMAHVAQQYRGMAPIYRPKCPFYWEEGIAEYVRYKVGYTNGWGCPQCAILPHYTSGYFCAGAFLLYLDEAYGSEVIHQLHTRIREGKYSEAFFAQATGKSLGLLWQEFQTRPAYTPIAAEINNFCRQLGYEHRKLPHDFWHRVETYIARQPGGKLTLEARSYWFQMLQENRMPGFSKELGAWVSYGMPSAAEVQDSPALRTFHCQQNGESSLYHYTLVHKANGRGWILKRAWRTSPDGQVAEEYPGN